jgi:acyl transferase domain-containing protein
MDPTPPVAIVGMACIFPGAGDLGSYWKNLVAGHDAIREVPAARWEPVFFDPESSRVDRLYCKRGGFIDEFARFDALHWGVMPLAAQGYEPDQLLALETCAAALADAGLSERDFPRETTGVILGRGGYLNSGMARFASKVRTSQELVQCLERLVPGLSTEQLERVRAEFQAKLGHPSRTWMERAS